MKKKIADQLKLIKGGATPYLLGWVFGVPVSLLVVIYLIRGH